ncbi:MULTISPECIES: hemagglutinin repeat-containing protein [Pelosinus]|uniref:Filamentous hemagglutinin family outer membrane protein n=1 Tax=Pelosinus fermentans B4 TaxID=1149862 RepID=I9L7C5_9FIRM|nr:MULTISPECIES: hemagglutinin repeat-containing protein [Pelosinus]EIW16274.1 filamentous hemagglutinin family outer membrane protein [Pelosinus fermentans B4]EIW22745.1 filamentous hemagglutinin family outer membrane protein [Pelosinus fermentans A11]OAM95581.1 filamentous hemagglutinin family outer membrane protein [Pelosinus fermentans DSM 17108]SDR30102.1 filamentous hemagglutinin [Pelosinus fermentans]
MASSSKAKSFAFYTTVTWRRKVVAWSMLFFYLTQPIVASAEVIADPKAPPNTTPIVQPAANGLPIVQIAAPTAGGVSHNLYQKFNVDPSGLILNNSRVVTQTQLAGYITGNPNLANGSARIILNEVTSSNPSYLRGYTEVAGQKAEVIIANPNGIYGDGFGFINTSRAVLTTGTPVFGGSGSLDAFRVTGGQISIQGAGMNASDVDQVDIISRSVDVNAGVWAKNLNVIAGSNQVDHNTLHTETIAGDVNIPQVAVDVGQLGGMYAQKIYLVGTEKGVGVNSKGTIAAQAGDITINSAGKVLLAGNTSAAGNIQVTAQEDVSNQNTLYAQGNTSITTQGALENSGTLAAGQHTTLHAQSITSTGTLGAGVKTDGTLGNAGDLTLNASGVMQAQGQNMAAGNLTINGAAIDLVNSKNYVGGNASITTTMGDIDHSNGTMQIAGDLNLNAQGVIRNDNGTINAEQLTLSGEAISNRSGILSQLGQEATSISAVNSIDNTSGTMNTNGDSLTIQADSLINSQGQIQHAGTGGLSVQAANNIKNDKGKIATNGQLYLAGNEINTSKGTIAAQKNINLISQSALINEEGIMISGDAIEIQAGGEVDNQQGVIEANKGINLTALALNNQSGKVTGLDTSGIQIAVADKIDNTSGIIGSNGNLQIKGNRLINESGNIISQGNLAIHAVQGIDYEAREDVQHDSSIISGGDLNVTSEGKVVLLGNTSVKGNISLDAKGAIENQGTLYSQKDTNLTTQGTLKNTGTLVTGKNTILSAQDIDSKGTISTGVQSDGSLGTSGDLTMNADETVTASGNNIIAGNLVINGAGINLSGSITYAGSSVTLTAVDGDIDNTASSLETDGALIATAKGTIRNDKGDNGVVANIGAQRLTLVANSISNKGGKLTQFGSADTMINASADIDNTNGEITTNGSSLYIDSNSLDNNLGKIGHAGTGILSIETKDSLKNDSGKLTSQNQILLKAKSIENLKGTIAAQKDIDITATSALNNHQGLITSLDDAVTITSQGSVTNQQGSIEANKGLFLTARSLQNESGKVINMDTSNINVAVTNEINNQNGILGGNGQVTIEAEKLNNIGGQVLANDNLSIALTNELDNTDGKIVAKKNLTLTQNSAELNNTRGNIGAGTDMMLQIAAINNSSGKIASEQDMNLNLQEINGNGEVIAGNDLTMNASGDLFNGSELKANRNLTVNAVGMITNQGTIGAVKNLTVSGSSIQNDSESTLSSGENLTATGSLVNHGTIEGDTVAIDGQTVRNTEAIIGHNLTITADHISNEGASALLATTGNMNLYAGTALENKDDASIYSMGDIVIAGSKDENGIGEYDNRTGTVLNQSANIEAEKDISINADEITNKKREFVTEQVVVYTNTTHETASIPNNGGYSKNHMEDSLLPAYYDYSDEAPIRVTYVSKDQVGTETVMETLVTKDSPVGKILSGRNMTLRASTVNNEMSWILAKGVLDTVAGTVNNTAVGSTRVTYYDGKIVYRKHFYRKESSGSSGMENEYPGTVGVDRYTNETIPTHTETTEQLPGFISLYGGSQGVTIQAKTINNQTIQPDGAPIGDMATTTLEANKNTDLAPSVNPGLAPQANIAVGNTTATPLTPGQSNEQLALNSGIGNPSLSLPSNALYTIHKEPGNKPLIETNSRFTSYTSFISSDYMLNSLGLKPEETQKRLGDGFYEQKLVREQIANLTGLSSLNANTSAEEEYKTLMTNGVAFAQQFNLQVGVALTSEQVRQLTSDMVWLVEKEVEGQKVLVPVVYLSQVNQTNLQPSGALIIGETVNITATDDFTNSGVVHGTTKSDITAENIINRGGVIDGGNTTKLTAAQDIINQSGTITGGQLNLTAKRDIINETLVSAVNAGPINTTMVNQTGTIAATDGLVVKADRDLLITGAQVSSGKGIELEAGRDVKVTSVEHQQGLQTMLDGLNVSSEKITNITSSIKAGDNLTITAQQDVTLQGAQIKAGKAVDISAGDTLEISSVENKESGSAVMAGSRYYQSENIAYDKITNIASHIDSGSDMTLKGNDINIRGAQISAAQNIDIDAKHDLTVTSTQDTSNIQAHGSSIFNRTLALETAGLSNTEMAFQDNNVNYYSPTIDYSKQATKNHTTDIKAGKNVDLSAQNDVVVKGIQVDAGNDANLTAGGNISVTAVKDEIESYYSKGNNRNYNRTRTDDETIVGSQLNANNDIIIKAGPSTADSNAMVNNDSSKGNILIEGSSVISKNGKVDITADNEIVIQEDTERHETLTESRKVKKSTFSKKVTEKRDHTIVNEVSGSTISGNSVSINSKNSDLTVQASSVVGTEDVSLSAKEDVNILSAAETGTSEHYSYTKKSGLFSGGGLGLTIGSQSTKTTTNEQILGQVGSTIGSIDGNISVKAGEKVNSEGTTFVSGKDLSITGKEVTIDNTIDTYDSKTKYEFKQTGLSVSLGGGIVNTATSAYNNIKRSGQVEDERLKALYDYKAFKDLDKINDQLDNGMSKENLKKGVSVSVSIGSSKMTSEETVHTETVNTSNVNAGGDVTIKATEGDVNLKGTNINGENITLDAAENVNIGAAENKQQTTTNTSSSSWSVGGAIGSGFFGNVSKGSGKENENATTNTASIIDANETLTIKSGKDTNIIGSQVSGDKVVADIDGNLNLVSKQDTDDYTSKNHSSGFGFTTGPKGGITGSVSKGKTDSTYASVTEQAGIHAGEGGFDIHVGKNTDLKGAVIEAPSDKNKLSTYTLTYSDIQNKAEYSASSVGVNLNTRKDAEKKDAGLTPNIGGTASGDADSTTKSAISPGTIEIRSNPNQDLSNLSRDTNNSLNVLGKIFDKKTVQEQQELANVFGQEVFKAVGDLKLKEGSSEKAAIDFFVGGLMAKLGGGDFLSGAASGGITQLVMKELANIKNPALLQWASAVVGAAAAKVVGGNVGTGISVAISETKNNFLSHEQYAEYQAQLKELKEKLEDGSITQEEYNATVNEVTNYWADKDKEQNKQWLADNHIEAVIIDFGSVQIALEKQQYQQMLIELSNSKNDEETAAIKEKWNKISDEQIDKWVKMGEDLGYNMDGSKTSLFPDLSTEVVNINNPYTAWLVKTETENSLFWAERSLQAQGIDPNDPSNAQLLAAEVEKQLGLNKEIQESIASSIGGGSFKTFKELKAFLGSPGAGNQWHHIVEQAQQNAKRAGFAAEEINSVENIIALQSGKGSYHSEISAFYSSKPDFTKGLTVRDWLANKSFQEQFEFGMNYLRKFGNVVNENGRWIFKSFE